MHFRAGCRCLLRVPPSLYIDCRLEKKEKVEKEWVCEIMTETSVWERERERETHTDVSLMDM